MRWRALVEVVALLALAACQRDEAVRPEATEPTLEPPEIVLLVSIDTLRADHLGTYGYERFTSPVIDALAAEGVVFEDASAPAPWTLPSHASMLTGLYPLRHGITSTATALPDAVPTLAGLLGEAGWATAAAVNSTWLKRNTYRITRDFDLYLAVDDADYGRRTPNTWLTDQVIEWIRTRDDRPLFVLAHYYDVHADYASLPEYERLFVTPYDGPADGTGWQLQVENFDPAHIAHCLEEPESPYCAFGSKDKPRAIGPDTHRIDFDADDVRHLEELYDAGVRQIDAELGRLLRFLAEAGLRQRTLVIVTSDHGEEFMEHGRVEHFLTTYQEMLHVPWIMRGPGLPTGMRVSAPVSLVDLVPTVLSLAQVPLPGDLDGLDLTPLLHGRAMPALADRPLWGEATGAEGFGPPLDGIYPLYRSVREGRYKLVRDARSDRIWLYDLSSDPGEQHDLASARPEVAARLESMLRARHEGETGPRGEAAELDAEDLERLRALGYVP